MKRPEVNRPLVFAHRGASKVAPENTLPAFQAAMDLGADGVELDVQYSSDGGLVVIHNPNLEATTNGTGRVTSRSLEELRALDAGNWFDERFAGVQIPLLEEVLELLKGRLLVNIELKSLDSATMGIGRDVVEVVRDHGMIDDVVISSFNPFALRRAKRAGPEIECALLTAPDLPGWMRSGIIRWYSRADSLHPEAVMIDAGYVSRARKRGMAVRAWTVDDEEEMRRLIALGVDAIVTDVPDKLVQLLNAQTG